MAHTDFELTVLGARGSMATCGAAFLEYGGNTSCYMIRAGEETIFLDAGSGILSAPADFPRPPVILLSHLHLDHVMGLGMFPLLAQKGKRASLYVPFCEDAQAACAQMDRVFCPPFWPLKLGELEAELRILPLPERFRVGEVLVTDMAGCHPGGCVVYRLDFAGKAIVYATDYEHGQADGALADFARNADLLLYDAQYEAAEYDRKKGFGHSTVETGLELMERADIGRMLLIHHSPESTDSVLRQREEALRSERVSFAREGQRITV